MKRARPIVFIINGILCLSFGFGVLVFALVGRPYMRGFYCDDESINKPFINSTVPSAHLVIVCVVVTAATVLAIEYFNSRFSTYKRQPGSPLVRHVIRHPAVTRSAWVIAAWLNGMGITQFAVDVGKYSVGRLRPHFLSACNPDWSKLNCTALDGRVRNYIVSDDVCRWTVSKYYQKDSRLSFPSGHSSFAAYCGLFLILYIELEVHYGGAYKRVPKLFVEATIALLAFVTMLTRVSDYKHHPTDVIAGCLLGLTVAPVIIFRVLRLGRRHAYGSPVTILRAEDAGSRKSVDAV